MRSQLITRQDDSEKYYSKYKIVSPTVGNPTNNNSLKESIISHNRNVNVPSGLGGNQRTKTPCIIGTISFACFPCTCMFSTGFGVRVHLRLSSLVGSSVKMTPTRKPFVAISVDTPSVGTSQLGTTVTYPACSVLRGMWNGPPLHWGR